MLSKMCPHMSPHRSAAAELEAQHEDVADDKVSATTSKSIGVESRISAPPTLERSVAHCLIHMSMSNTHCLLHISMHMHRHLSGHMSNTHV